MDQMDYEIDLIECLRILGRRKWLILTIHNGKCAQRIYNKRDNDKDLQHLMYDHDKA
jgi:hypothetical protein